MNLFYHSLGFLGNLGPWEIFLIVFLALLLFGGKKLPGLARDLGQGIREFRRSLFGNPEDENLTQSKTELTLSDNLSHTHEVDSHPAPKKQAKSKNSKSTTTKKKS